MRKGWHRLGIFVGAIPATIFVVMLFQAPTVSDTWLYGAIAVSLYIACVGLGWVVDGFKGK